MLHSDPSIVPVMHQVRSDRDQRSSSDVDVHVADSETRTSLSDSFGRLESALGKQCTRSVVQSDHKELSKKRMLPQHNCHYRCVWIWFRYNQVRRLSSYHCASLRLMRHRGHQRQNSCPSKVRRSRTPRGTYEFHLLNVLHPLPRWLRDEWKQMLSRSECLERQEHDMWEF